MIFFIHYKGGYIVISCVVDVESLEIGLAALMTWNVKVAMIGKSKDNMNWVVTGQHASPFEAMHDKYNLPWM
jgi:hypothetical protein